MCQIVLMQRALVKATVAFAVLVAFAAEALAQPDATDWDLSAREFEQRSGGSSDLFGRPGGAATTHKATLDALDKILSSSRLSAFDRSLYLGIRAYQLSRLGREADSLRDVTEMAKALPEGWSAVLAGIVPELAGGGDRAAALRTLDYGLQRKPGDPRLAVGQAQVYLQIAEFDHALDLLDLALAGATTESERRAALFVRGHADFDLGRYDEAAADFDAFLTGRPLLKSRMPSLLWRYAAQVRAKREARSALARDLDNENLDEWPGPIAKFLLGRIPAGELEVAAETGEAAKRANGKCPAAFFIAIDAVRRGARQRAREQLQLAQARCPTVSEFNWAASSELKRL